MKKLLLVLALLPLTAGAFESPRSGPVDQYYFDTDSAEVVAPGMSVSEGDSVVIVGHADHRASVVYNHDLGLDRAKAVARAIGRPAATVMSEGETHDTCAAGDHACMKESRRADVFVDCSIDQFACLSDYPESWMGNVTPEYDPLRTRFVSDRSRF